MPTRSMDVSGNTTATISRVTPWIVLIILLVTAVALFFVFRRYDPNDPKNVANQSQAITKSVREKFQDPANEIVHKKNGNYIPPLREFFASTDGSDSHSIMFYPSIVDVACTTMSDTVKADLTCSNAYVDTVSVQDRESMITQDSKHLCNSMAMSREPMDPRDATLRVLQGRYSLVKTCLRVRYSALDELTNGNGYDLKVPSGDESTMFIMLNRPLMMCANGTKLYKVELPAEYNSRVDNTLTIKLKEMNDTTIWPNTSGFNSTLKSIYGHDLEGEPAIMNCTMYYLRYIGPMKLGANDVVFDNVNVVSLCIRMSKIATTPDETNQAEKLFDLGESVSNSDMKVHLTYNSEYDSEDTGDVKVTIAGEDFYLREIDMKDGYVIVVYTTDRLLVYYLSRSGVKYIKKTTATTNNITGADLQALRSNLMQKGFNFPVTCFPNEVTGIPNFHDLYRKLVTFS